MKAYELLNSPEKWTQGTLARNKYNDSVDPTSSEACCWCAFGAIVKCYDAKSDQDKVDQLCDAIWEHGKFHFIGTWNDHSSRTYEDVIKLLKELDI